MNDANTDPASPPTLDDILHQRAARQAIVDVDEPTTQLVVFTLGADWFAFAAAHVREILAQAQVFFVPGCPPALEGVINVRGDIQSVLRLHSLLQLPAGKANGAILLAQSSSMGSGIRIDQVIDVVTLPHSSIGPPPATLSTHWRALVTGITQVQGHAVSILDLEQLLSDYARGQE